MNHLERQAEIIAANERSLLQLQRAINLSQGQFSLILACCKSGRWQEEIAKKLRNASSLNISELHLPQSAIALYTTIRAAIADSQPQALMVFGLESVVAIEQLLVATNLVRDEFRKQFSFPLILWVNEDILPKLTRLAPDFRNWAAAAIAFDAPSNKVIEFRHRAARRGDKRLKSAAVKNFAKRHAVN